MTNIGKKDRALGLKYRGYRTNDDIHAKIKFVANKNSLTVNDLLKKMVEQAYSAIQDSEKSSVSATQ